MTDSVVELRTDVGDTPGHKAGNETSNPKFGDDRQRETHNLSCQQQFDKEDYSFKLLNDVDNSVYNDCTIPLSADNNNTKYTRNNIPAVVSNSDSTTPLTTGDGEFTVINLDRTGGDDEAQVRYTNKSTTHGDGMMHSINSLRLNVNNHLIGGSKNVMGRMRKLSISDLNRHGRNTSRRAKIAFYAALIALSLLFLYLIYQNLFNDR